MEEKEFIREKEHLRFIGDKINEYLSKNTVTSSDLKSQIRAQRSRTVSYTHLDVYKRQLLPW